MPKISKLSLLEVSNVSRGSNGRPFLLLRAQGKADKPFDKNSETATVNPTGSDNAETLNRGIDMTPEEQKAKDEAAAAAAAPAPESGAPEQIDRAAYDAQAAEVKELKRQLEEQTITRAMEVEINRTKESLSLVGDSVKVGTAVFEVKRALASKAISQGTHDTLMDVLQRHQALVAKGPLLGEVGAGMAPNGAAEQMQSMARELSTKTGIHIAKAVVEIARANSELYQQAQLGA